MPQVNCENCKNKFYAKPSHIKNGYGKFCSAKCHHNGQRTGKFVECFICKQVTYKARKALKGSKSGNFFCGKSCQTKWRNSEFIAEKHANYKTGEYTYRTILLKSGLKKMCIMCKTEDYRILTVHHIDENHFNNNVKNLTWLCFNCHFLVHHSKDEKRRFELLRRN